MLGTFLTRSRPESLQCQGAWRRFQSRLYRASSAPVFSNREVAAVLGDVALLLEEYSELGEDEARNECPLGQMALRLAQALPAARLDAVEELLGRDFHLLQAFGWNALVRSGWPVFQLLYLLYRCMQDGQEFREDPCMNSEGYAWKLQQRLLQRPSTEELGLMAASWAFLASEEAQACHLVASAALLAIVWVRLPVYDVESDGLIAAAHNQILGFCFLKFSPSCNTSKQTDTS